MVGRAAGAGGGIGGLLAALAGCHAPPEPVDGPAQTGWILEDPAPDPAAPPYRSGERMVRLHVPADAAAVAADHGVALQRAPGRSGYAVLAGDRAALAGLTDDPRVALVAPHAATHGASAGQAQWHHDHVASKAPMQGSSWVVAILDTGVAYETATRSGVAYTQASGLSGNPIVAPYDFIHDDAYANDDHQHGTHIAGLIAANGVTKGIVPGVSLMPIKVLDQANAGTEIALVDGILHAVANGADVINMSLSFGEGYQPSLALQQALQDAHDAGIVMVAAAGNTAQDFTTWPAASPLVIAVGASKMVSDSGEAGTAGYSNGNGAIDIMAPGGDVQVDVNLDGYVDGLVAQSIDPADPTSVGYWLMAGTSQAAAVASGMAVRILDQGYAPGDVYAVMQDQSDDGEWTNGTGAGFIESTSPFQSSKTGALYYAAVLPYLQDAGADVVPAGRVTLFEADGSAASSKMVAGSIWGNGDGTVFCQTDGDGVCTLTGAAMPKVDGTGAPVSMAWAISVEAVNIEGVIHHPRAMLTSSTAFDDLVAGIRAEVALADALLGWSWTDASSPMLGSVAAGYSVVNNGAGFASAPLGVVATPAAVQGMSNITAMTVMAGVHQVSVDAIDLDGTGLASIPLGFQQVQLAVVDGTGLSSPGLGLLAEHVHGDGATMVPLDGNSPFDLWSHTAVSLTGSALADQLDEGGWMVEGYAAASALTTSSHLAISPSDAVGLDGAGHGVIELVE